MSGANGATEFKDVVGTLDELRALMGEPSEIALRKDIGRIDEHCRAFIARAPVCPRTIRRGRAVHPRATMSSHYRCASSLSPASPRR